MERMVNKMKFVVKMNDGSEPIMCKNLIQLSQHTGVSSSYLKGLLLRHSKDRHKTFVVNRVEVTIVE